VAVADWDDDGDTDVVVGNIDSLARLYRNDSPRRGKWLRVIARDPALKRYAIGAKVTLRCGEASWIRTVSRAYSYLTSNDPRLLFGVPDGLAGNPAELRVEWPDGLRETFPVEGFDREVTVDEINGAFKAASESGPLSKVVVYNEAPIVSTDIVGSPASCTFDAPLTMAMGSLVKVFGWYDNEWGYSNRVVDLAAIVGAGNHR